MRKFVTLAALLLLSFVIAEVVTQSQDQKQVLPNSCKPSSVKSCNSKANQINMQHLRSRRKRKNTRKEKCCHLGRKMAKIGDSCKYRTTLATIKPNFKHFHKMKTKIWFNADRPVIKVRLLKKCKRFKVFYEKCCSYESRLIDEDLRMMIKRLRILLRSRTKKGKKEKTF